MYIEFSMYYATRCTHLRWLRAEPSQTSMVFGSV